MPQSRKPVIVGNHEPVLLEEAVAGLNLRSGLIYVDATFGGGGHTRRMILDPVGIGAVIGIDVDFAAIERGNTLASTLPDRSRLTIVHGNFGDIASHLTRPVHGILMDLGLSSYQLDTPDRGFAFRHDAPLDMRFDQTSGPSARDLLENMAEADLADIIFRFGEERASRRIARTIVEERARAPIRTTGQLAAIVERAVGGRRGRPTHPATRTFQALRMAVNRELDMLDRGLRAAVDLLTPGGRLVVISFHSLEDRMVKRLIEEESRTCICPPEQPVCTCDVHPGLKRIGKTIKPGVDETSRNVRSRSAIMRIAERVSEASPTRGDGER